MSLQISNHVPVLLHESIDGLNLQKGDVVVDATINGGGHSDEAARRFGKDIYIIGFDLDEEALLRSEARLKERGAHFFLFRENFRNMKKKLDEKGIGNVDKILFDLGLSSDQLEAQEGAGRGFSFQKNEPLVMTFSRGDYDGITARQILNEWSEESISDILYGYGEERYAKGIARQIVKTRSKKSIMTTFDFVEVIKEATPLRYQKGKTHFATRSFQALRMAVNDEVGALRDGLKDGFSILKKGGRIAVISFHSIEDRIVKRFFVEKSSAGEGVRINKKPITPTVEGVEKNRRARSAKLRIIEKVK